MTCDLLVTYLGAMSDDDLIFKALSDPTRRFLLDRLFERDGRTLTELESDLEMTRFGVMKHLRVLEEAGLVVALMIAHAEFLRWATLWERQKAKHLADPPEHLVSGAHTAARKAAPATRSASDVAHQS